jgi:hypothetical protein
MRLQVLVVRDFAAAGPELDHVERVQGKPRQIRQPSGKRRFASAGIAEDRDSFHLARSVNMSPDAPSGSNRQVAGKHKTSAFAGKATESRSNVSAFRQGLAADCAPASCWNGKKREYSHQSDFV